MGTENWQFRVGAASRVLSVMALLASASGALAQQIGPRAIDPATLTQARPPEPPLTEAQKLVQDLGPIQEGFGSGWASYTPDSPMPSADPRDFSGAWTSVQKLEVRNQYDMYGTPTPYTMAGAQTVVRRVTGKKTNKPYAHLAQKCLPPGSVWQLDISGGILIFQSEKLIEFMFGESHARWNVALDPTILPPEGTREYMGRSIGHWDGDTLVVETSNFKRDLWIDSDGSPLSKNGKTIQRIRKVNGNDRRPYLEVVTKFVDPANYTHEWSIVRTFSWQPTRAQLREYNCEEQVGDPSGVTDSGFLTDTEQ